MPDDELLDDDMSEEAEDADFLDDEPSDEECGVADALVAMATMLERSGRPDLARRYQRAIEAAESLQLVPFFHDENEDAEPAGFLPVLGDPGSERELRFLDEACELMNGVHADFLVHRDAGLEPPIVAETTIARLVHLVATRQTDDRGEAQILWGTFLEKNPRRPASAAADSQTGGDLAYAMALGRWFGAGCPVLRLDDKLAAALMFSDLPGEELSTVEPPWPAFKINVPNGLLPSHAAPGAFIKSVLVARARIDDQHLWDWTALDDAGKMLSNAAFNLQDISKAIAPDDLEAQINETFFGKASTATKRMADLVGRLVKGVVAMMQEPTSISRVRPKKGAVKWRLSKEPATTEYVLGSNVRVQFDCREAVASCARGERKNAPTVQWIVRGHWRNQPHGPGRAERKRMWIQPYWKGPEDAPRLLREHRVLAPKEEPASGGDGPAA